MELVYLWVKKYKNIENEGFNFSPRFTCSYDKDTKDLTIDENKEHVEDFFGKNINVTAIVGENGSGKTTVLDILTNMNGDLNKLILYFDGKQLIVKNTLLESLTMGYIKTGVTQLEKLKHNTEVYENFQNRYQKKLFSGQRKKI